jgi:hypothetical protein
MRIYIRIVLLLVFMSGCYSLHDLHKIQSDNKLRKTENLNFLSSKATTQWWYFDCFFEDGSVLVFLFTPQQWWSEKEKMPTYKSLFYFSYMKANGEVISESKVFDSKEVQYDEKSLKSPYFELFKSHGKNTREYTINFLLDEIKGSAKIRSGSKAFSPFPTGHMGPFGMKHIAKCLREGADFRYASHVPQGKIDCNLDIKGTQLSLSGKTYHEQGCFNGTPDEMGKGWTWFHFVSKNINLFGTPKAFLCLEKEGKRLIGGADNSTNGCVLSDMVYTDKLKNFLIGGKLSFASTNLSFIVTPSGQPSTTLIRIPSFDTDQVWGTSSQPSLISINHDGKKLEEEGRLLLEMCNMNKKNP